MATRARSRSVANAVPRSGVLIEIQPVPVLQVATDVAPVSLTGTATSTPSSYGFKQTTDLAVSPASTRTSLSTASPIDSLQRKTETMSPRRSVSKLSESHAAPAKDTGITALERQGRPTRKSKPTTKAIELANNTNSKLFKSLKKDDQVETLEVEEAEDEAHRLASKESGDKATSATASKTASSIPLSQETKNRSPTAETSTSEPYFGSDPELVSARRSEARGRDGTDRTREAVSSQSAALGAPSRPRKRVRAQENDEVIEHPAKKQQGAPAPAARTGRLKRNHDEESVETVMTPAKRPRRTAKANHEIDPASDLDTAPTVTELAEPSKPALSKTRRKRGTKASITTEVNPISGSEGYGPLSMVPKITLRFPSSASMAGSEELRDSDIEGAGTNQSRTTKVKRQTQASSKGDKKSKAKDASTPKTKKRERRSPSPAQEVEEPSEDELAPGPVKPRRTRRAKHASFEAADNADNHTASPNTNPHGKKLAQKSNTAAEGQQQQSNPKKCDGSCLTLEEKLIAMTEVMLADHEPDTQEELDALMVPYCKCKPRERDEEQVPVRTLKLRFQGLKKGNGDKS